MTWHLQTSSCSVHNQIIISTRVGTQQILCTTRDLHHFSFPQTLELERQFLTCRLIRWACRPTRRAPRTVCPWSALTTTCMNITAPSTSQPSALSINTSSSELTGRSKYNKEQRGNIFIDKSRYNLLLWLSNLTKQEDCLGEWRVLS